MHRVIHLLFSNEYQNWKSILTFFVSTYRYFLVISCMLLLWSCGGNEERLYWKAVGTTLDQWKRIESQTNHIMNSSGMKMSHWECWFNDLSDTNFSAVCFVAPDDMNFKLWLNQKQLINTNDRFGSWPSSYNDSLFVYPNDHHYRPFVIDANDFKNALRSSGNQLSVYIHDVPESAGSLSGCGLFLLSKNGDVATSSPHFERMVFKQNDLPVMRIDIDNFLIDRHGKTLANFQLKCNSEKEKNCIEVQSQIKIGVRGFSSSIYPKKQYSIKIASDSTRKERLELLGMQPARNWILQGPYADPSLIRNAFAYQIWREMGRWAAQSKFVELIVNGTYEGVYLLMEKIEMDRARLDLLSGAPLKSAFLVQIDRANKDDSVAVVQGIPFIIKDPDGGKITTEYLSMVRRSLEPFASNASDPQSNQENIDISSFVDFILVQELLKNIDAYAYSTYLHRSESDNKVSAGPVWDFDQTMGSSKVRGGEDVKGWMIENASGVPGFWRALFNSPFIKEKMKSRYLELRSNQWSDAHLNAMIDSHVNAIHEDPIERNAYRYPVNKGVAFANRVILEGGFDGEIVYMKKWLSKRAEWMDEYFKVN